MAGQGARVTLKDLAQHLNMAHSTVSRALSGNGSIGSETRDRVRQAARQFGYVANSGARLLRNGHSNVVGLLVPDFTNEFYSAIAQRMANECSQRGYQLMLSVSGNDAKREASMVEALLETRPSGLVVALTAAPRKETLDHLKGVPCVQFLRVHSRVAGAAVTIDDVAGGRLATEHLLSLGHRSIAYVGVPEALSTGTNRLLGFQNAMRLAGGGPDPALLRLTPPTGEGGFEAVTSLMKARATRPTALFLSSPQLALGGMRAISHLRLATPGDLSVVTYGNSGWLEIWPGGLTSVQLPVEELAATASALLLQKASDTQAANVPVTLMPQLVIRGSTGRCVAA
jgi:LacI family transcriptional regulator